MRNYENKENMNNWLSIQKNVTNDGQFCFSTRTDEGNTTRFFFPWSSGAKNCLQEQSLRAVVLKNANFIGPTGHALLEGRLSGLPPIWANSEAILRHSNRHARKT